MRRYVNAMTNGVMILILTPYIVVTFQLSINTFQRLACLNCCVFDFVCKYTFLCCVSELHLNTTNHVFIRCFGVDYFAFMVAECKTSAFLDWENNSIKFNVNFGRFLT